MAMLGSARWSHMLSCYTHRNSIDWLIDWSLTWAVGVRLHCTYESWKGIDAAADDISSERVHAGCDGLLKLKLSTRCCYSVTLSVTLSVTCRLGPTQVGFWNSGTATHITASVMSTDGTKINPRSPIVWGLPKGHLPAGHWQLHYSGICPSYLCLQPQTRSQNLPQPRNEVPQKQTHTTHQNE